MQSTPKDTARRLTVLAGLLSQDHALFLVRPVAGNTDYIQPIYLAELLVSNPGLGIAVLEWADGAGIAIGLNEQRIGPTAPQFDGEVGRQLSLAEKPGPQARAKLLAFVPDAEEVLAHMKSAHANTSDSELGSVETSKAKVVQKVKI